MNYYCLLLILKNKMKKIIYTILALVLIYLIFAFLCPKEIKVERSIIIKKPSQIVLAKLTDFKFFHEKWSPFTKLDSNMKTTYSGNAGKAGHLYSWKSDKDAGNGEMEIKEIKKDSVIMRLTFEGMGDSKTYYILNYNSDETAVTWGIIFDVDFLFRPLMVIMGMDKKVGEEYEKGLSKLKNEIEALPSETSYEVKELNWEAKSFYGLRTTTSLDKLSAFFTQAYSKIGEIAAKSNVKPINFPKAIYFSFDEKTLIADVAATMEFTNGGKLNGLEKWDLPAGKVLLIEYYGAYEKSANAHHAMDNYIKEKGLTQNFCIEEYVTDPVIEKDTTKWLTNIYYLVK